MKPGERKIDLTSGVAWVLIEEIPPTEAERRAGVTCRRLYYEVPASLAERLALVGVGRRICSQ